MNVFQWILILLTFLIVMVILGMKLAHAQGYRGPSFSPGGPSMRGYGDPRLYGYPGGSGPARRRFPSYSGPSFSPGGASSYPYAPQGPYPYYGRPGGPSYKPYFVPAPWGGAHYQGCPNEWC